MGHVKGERLIQNRILAGTFGGLLLLAGIAMLIVGSMLYLALYEEYKNQQYESAICFIEATSIVERQSVGYSDYQLHYVLLVNVNFTSKDNNTHEGSLEYKYYSDVAPAKLAADQLQRDEHINCYYSTTDYTPRLDKPPLEQYLAKGIGIVATGIMALLGGLALLLYLIISITKQRATVAKIAKNTITATTPAVKTVGSSNH